MKKVFLYSLILALALSIFVSCQSNKSAENDGIVEVVNEEEPLLNESSITFVEDLVITKEGWYPNNIAVDDSGSIYVFGKAENSIIKFDSQGNEIFKKVFPRGQGPGEFFFMDPYFSSNGRLYLFDKQQYRLSILNQDCELLDSKKTKGYKINFRLDSNGNMFFWELAVVQDSDAERYILSKFSQKGKLLDEILEFTNPESEYDRGKATFFLPLHPTIGMYKLDPNDNVYFALSDKYEIGVVNSHGDLIRKIMKKGLSRKVTEQDIENSLRQPSSNNVRIEYVPPERVPYIADFFILENKSLLIITFESLYNDSYLLGDLFGEDGKYLCRIKVPLYYLWDELYFALKGRALYKNEFFYVIQTDEYQENFFIKRYKIKWIQ